MDLMAKILVTADWHFDYWPSASTSLFGMILDELEGLDALIIAGDLTDDPELNWPKLFRFLADHIDLCRVYVIPGNHDYYGWRLDDDEGLRKIAENSGVNFAQKSAIEVGGDRFICCTLWTDFKLFGDHRIADAMRETMMFMPDYDLISVGPEERMLDPADLLDVHKDHLAWIGAELKKPFDGRSFVVTHHGPHPRAALPITKLSAGFVSNLTGFITRHRPDVWLFGHTHWHQQTYVGSTLIKNVSLGYSDEIALAEQRDLLMRGLIDNGEVL